MPLPMLTLWTVSAPQVSKSLLSTSNSLFWCAGVVSLLAGSGSVGTANGQGAAASFNFPTGITVTNSSLLFVCDRYNHAIRSITTGGEFLIHLFIDTALL